MSAHSETKHTPWPWTAHVNKNDEHEFYVTDAEHSVVAYLAGIYDGQMDVARLIAAAPELLEALRMAEQRLAALRAYVPEHMLTPYLLDRETILRAIAKVQP